MDLKKGALRLGATSKPSRLSFETLEPRQMLAGDGLTGEYFNESNLTSLAGTRVDSVVNFSGDALGDDAQGMVASDDVYSIRWSGWVNIEQAGQWQFTTFSNDGVRLWVDGTQLIDNWTTHTSTRDDGSITLDVGWHPIQLEYFQQNGTTDARLLFSGPGQTEAIIPQTHLCTTDPNIGDPNADAGPDRVVVLPTNSVTLDGSATDDGTIVSYAWSQISGPNTAVLSGANTEDLTASSLVEGTYEFQLTVTDNDTNTDSDTVLVNVFPAGGGGLVSGELKRWHKITIDFLGPNTDENATTNPFTDYRLDVIFTHQTSGTSYVVPGYYAADGDAANTSASSGNVWRVHFAPDETGDWAYSVSFRTGANVAMSDLANPGTTAGHFDGATGSFTVAESDKTGIDLRSKGRLNYVGERYLQFAGTGEYFLKQGPDAPENFLAYDEFDGPFATDGQKDNLVKNWAPHVADWNPGDPTWGSDQGKGIIGAVNYLASEGLNAFSFLPMNIDGDDRNVFPYLDYNERLRMDVSRLAQWEIVFEHADHMGMFLHFKTQETENDDLLDNGALGNQRKLYYRELIARFSHHLALNWNLGEENTNTTQQRKDFAQYFHDNDPYQHHIVLHTYPGQKDAVYDPLLGNASELTGASLQTSNADFSQVHADTVKWVNDSAAAGKPWAIAVDEPGDADFALRPDNNPGNSHEDGRKNALWGTFMGGGWGNEWYFGYQLPESDLTLQDFRSRDSWWDYTRYALEFFNDNEIPFWQMQNDNSISTASDDYGFYKSDDTYVVYLKDGGTTSLDLTAASGTFEVKWFDPRNGGSLQNGTVGIVEGGDFVSLGDAPNSTTEDWAILVRKQEADAKNVLFIRGSAGSGGFLEGGSDEQLADITNQQTFGGNHGWGTLADTLTGAGYTLHQIIEGETPDGSGTAVPLSTLNLDIYDAIVFGSNNAVYSQADVTAFDQYITSGGSALLISDANFGSDWADAPNSDQQFLDLIGIEVHQDQGTYVVGNSSGEILAPNHPIFAGSGPAEVVSQFDGEGVSPFHIKETVTGVGVILLAGAEGNTRLNQPPFGANQQGPSVATTGDDASAFSATYGSGRIVGHYDRNTFFNLNGAGTNITRFDNQQYAINIFNWLTSGPNLEGDYNQDNLVDGDDLNTWTSNYGSDVDLNADGNDSGRVEGFDFLLWQRNFGATAPSPVVVNSTAAPSVERVEEIAPIEEVVPQEATLLEPFGVEPVVISTPQVELAESETLPDSPQLSVWLSEDASRSLFAKAKTEKAISTLARREAVLFEQEAEILNDFDVQNLLESSLLEESELTDFQSLLDRALEGIYVGDEDLADSGLRREGVESFKSLFSLAAKGRRRG